MVFPSSQVDIFVIVDTFIETPLRQFTIKDNI